MALVVLIVSASLACEDPDCGNLCNEDFWENAGVEAVLDELDKGVDITANTYGHRVTSLPWC